MLSGVVFQADNRLGIRLGTRPAAATRAAVAIRIARESGEIVFPNVSESVLADCIATSLRLGC
jgi:hypothetical protein